MTPPSDNGGTGRSDATHRGGGVEEGGVANEEVRSAAEAGTKEAGERPMAGAVGDRRPAACYGGASLTGGGGQVGTSGEDNEDRDRLRFFAMGSNPRSVITTTTHSATSMEPTPAAQHLGDRKSMRRLCFSVPGTHNKF